MRVILLALSILFLASAGEPAPLSAEEKVDLLLVRARVAILEKRQLELVRERDAQIEAAIRQAVERWYQSQGGNQFVAVTAEVDRLNKELNQKLEAVRKKHGVEPGRELDQNLNWR
jgi:hypothetical protein